MIDLYEIPSLVLCAVLIVALLGSIEVGQIIGRRTREADWDATSGAFFNAVERSHGPAGALARVLFQHVRDAA
jgi:glycerol-3-phosphate acyltransferase PlsY